MQTCFWNVYVFHWRFFSQIQRQIQKVLKTIGNHFAILTHFQHVNRNGISSLAWAHSAGNSTRISRFRIVWLSVCPSLTVWRWMSVSRLRSSALSTVTEIWKPTLTTATRSLHNTSYEVDVKVVNGSGDGQFRQSSDKTANVCKMRKVPDCGIKTKQIGFYYTCTYGRSLQCTN